MNLASVRAEIRLESAASIKQRYAINKFFGMSERVVTNPHDVADVADCNAIPL